MAARSLGIALVLSLVSWNYVAGLTLDEATRNKLVTVHSFVRGKMEPLIIGEKLKQSLDIFCYEGVQGTLGERIRRMFSTGKLHINMSSDDFLMFSGQNESHVWDLYQVTQQSWISWMPWQPRSISVSLFNRTCVGIAAKKYYEINLVRRFVDLWLLLYFFTGVILFFSAKRLSRNILFYYGTGISIGVLASILILFFILSKFLPWRKGAYAFLIGGWAVTSWAAVHLWTNMRSLMVQYYQYAVGYVLTAIVISFAVCYYRGPVRDPRSLNIIQWLVQFVAVLLVALSIQAEEVAAVVIVAMITFHVFPLQILQPFKRMLKIKFPRKRRLLTQEEYERQANESTTRALEELREYCRSPDCDAWRTISRIGSPQRFAKWVEGDSHITEEELEWYDSDAHTTFPEITDDEDEIDFRLNSL